MVRCLVNLLGLLPMATFLFFFELLFGCDVIVEQIAPLCCSQSLMRRDRFPFLKRLSNRRNGPCPRLTMQLFFLFFHTKHLFMCAVFICVFKCDAIV
ncbi:hypothetical protein BC939DRAFT_440233 [Gamsiella multidivaricata]|uniref:uncharacterized protein n=1 Tax=Gamsiella multidivaricata TaxID=101098 RepID=UPI00221F6554|nr:uncharacterized protein BC939DRAFT_440233 [Gamsiella multidivaricata]KAI7830335.1 hypothetical protein BC939DRAFT_440233 [Gamsiella multidivaricata]